MQVTWRHCRLRKRFASITPHRIYLEPRVRCHCVCLLMMHRLICNMTYLGHSLGQLFWSFSMSVKFWPKVWILNWPFGVKMYISKRLGTRNTMIFRVFLCLSLFKSHFQNCVSYWKATFFVWPSLRMSKCNLRRQNLVWLDSKHPELFVRLPCEPLLQLGSKWAGVAPPPPTGVVQDNEISGAGNC